jgi:hypothetical protein
MMMAAAFGPSRVDTSVVWFDRPKWWCIVACTKGGNNAVHCCSMSRGGGWL